MPSIFQESNAKESSGGEVLKWFVAKKKEEEEEDPYEAYMREIDVVVEWCVYG